MSDPGSRSGSKSGSESLPLRPRPPEGPVAIAAGRDRSSLPLVIRAADGIRFRLRSSGVEAGWRIARWAAAAAARHAGGRIGDVRAGRTERETRRRVRRDRTLARLARELAALKGAFAKAGQFAALRIDVLPDGARTALSALHDRVPPMPFRTVVAVLETELGAPLSRRFREIESEPVGAASIAQVHRAVLADGRRAALKVQYPWIEPSLASDLRWIRIAVGAWARFGRHRLPDRDRLVDELARGLAEELDFLREGRVAAEIAGNLRDIPEIVVPEIVASHSTRRVLAMTFHPTIAIDDPSELTQRGIPPRRVLEILARAYAKQIFADGLFHADPHPGNLFVLDEPRAASDPRVLFVDFGLSRRLEPALRRAIRLGIYALIRRDLDAFVDQMDALGMIAPGARPGVRDAVANMFETIGSRAGGGPLGIPGDRVLALKDEAVALLQETPGLQLPNDLLLYAKTLSYLFALGERLDPEVDLMQIAMPHVLRFLAERDERPS